MESDAKAFPRAAGFDEASADKLSDLRRKDCRNAGMFIHQVAPELGSKPKELIERLIKMAEYHPKSIATAAALTRHSWACRKSDGDAWSSRRHEAAHCL